MKTNTITFSTSRKNTLSVKITSTSTFNSNSITYNKILPANKVGRNSLFSRPATSNVLDRPPKSSYKSNPSTHSKQNTNTNDLSHFLSHSPNKTSAYIQSLKDKIFSPGDFSSSSSSNNNNSNSNSNYKQDHKSNSLIAELNKNIFNTPPPITKPIISANKIPSPLIYLPDKTYNHLSRKTLFLDLDETLVHSAFKPFLVKSDIVLNISFDQKKHTIHVLKRPHVDEFLDKMSKIFELVIFTASIPEYANPLLNKLDPNKHITSRLFREHCTSSNNLFVKDLKKVGRHLKDTILLDNNPVSYAFNKENGIPILTWHSNKNDTELLKLIPLLEYLAKTDDVRDTIQKVVVNNYVNYFEVNRLINPNKEEDKVKVKVKANVNQTMLNSLNTLNNSMNNGGLVSSNYSMNLFSHHFSSYYFDNNKDKDRDSLNMNLITISNAISTNANINLNKEKGTLISNKDSRSSAEITNRDKDKDKDKERNRDNKEKGLDLFSHFFENKKGTGNLFNDKKYKDKYDQFYDIKDTNSNYNSNSKHLFRSNSNKGIVLPSNEYNKKEIDTKATIKELYHQANHNNNINDTSSSLNINIKQSSDILMNQSLLHKSSLDQELSRATSSRSNNFFDSSYISTNKQIGYDSGIKHRNTLSNSIDKQTVVVFKRNRNSNITDNEYNRKRTNTNFIQKATISLQEPSNNIKSFNQLSNWDLNVNVNVNGYKSNLVSNRKYGNEDTKGKLNSNMNTNTNKDRNNLQTPRERLKETSNLYW